MIESLEALKDQVQEWLDRLPSRPDHRTQYAEGQALALNEVLKAISPEPRTPTVVVRELVGDRSLAEQIVRRLSLEGFLTNESL